MGQTAQRIGLIHELAQLAAAKEILHHGGERFAIDQAGGSQHAARGIEERHALANQTLSTRQTHAALVLQQFTGRADATAAEVVDVIDMLFTDVDTQQQADRLNHIDTALMQDPQIVGDLARQPQLLIDLVTPDLAQIVTARLEEEPLKQRLRIR